jgi:carboxyl-terminal processing protease
MKSALFFVSLACNPATADNPVSQPGSLDPAVATVVTNLLERYHYQRLELNDTVSSQWFDTYIERLDPNRVYFLASDLAEFEVERHQFDDDVTLNPARLEGAAKIYLRYQERMADRMAFAQKLLDQPIDLTTDAVWLLDRSEAPWVETQEDYDALWKLRVTDQLVRESLRDTEDEDDKEKPEAEQAAASAADLAENIETLKERNARIAHDVAAMEAADMLELWLSSLAAVYDPHSLYYKPASRDNFDIDMSNSVEGIGASLKTIGEYTVVQEIIAGGPADLDGRLKSGDKIIAVAQGKQEPMDVVDLRIDKVVKVIRGKKGSEVRLTIIPGDAAKGEQPKILAITRDKVILTKSDADAEVHEVPTDNGTLKVGTITLPSFYWDGNNTGKSAALDTRKHLEDLKQQGVQSIVLDLRANGGGSLQEAVALTGLFIPGGPVVQIRDQDGRIEALDDPDRRVVYEGPLVVLTDAWSASASEIVAGAIQDYDRGLVVGAKTHGKGTVQTTVDLAPMIKDMTRTRNIDAVRGSMLKLTTQKFYRISGASTQAKGVEPDLALPSPWEGYNIYESDLDNPLAWDEIDSRPHQNHGEVSKLTETLSKRSGERVEANEDFAAMRKIIDERERINEQKEVVLNLEKRRLEFEEQRKRLEAVQGESEGAQDAEEGEEEEEDGPDAILDEALLIAADLYQLSK